MSLGPQLQMKLLALVPQMQMQLRAPQVFSEPQQMLPFVPQLFFFAAAFFLADSLFAAAFSLADSFLSVIAARIP